MTGRNSVKQKGLLARPGRKGRIVRALAVLLSLVLVAGDAPLMVRASESGQESISENDLTVVSENDMPPTEEMPTEPPTEGEDTPPTEEGQEPETPPVEEGQEPETPPGEEGQEPPETPPGEEGQEPPTGEGENPPAEGGEQVSGNDMDSVSENDLSAVSENDLSSVSENDLDAEREAMIQEAQEAFAALASDKPLMALLYHADRYDARREAEADSGTAAPLEIGQTLYIQGVTITEDDVWYQAQYLLNGAEGSGYVQSYYLAYSDEDWLAWEEEYLLPILQSGEESYENTAYGMRSYSMMTYAVNTSDISAFPESYQAALRSLKNAHPNWTFVPMKTGLDFDTSVTKEMGAKSLIQKTTENTQKGWVGDPCPSESGWNYATKPAVAYHMDPRNFLTETYVFQFEQLTFNSSYHTAEAVQGFLNGTFMKGKLADDAAGRTYAQAFFEIGKSRKLSPTHLAARVYQEQGQGTSGLISGTYPGYEGYYNFFNVGVNGASTTEKIVKGLTYAKNQGWNTRYKSLDGGAGTIGKNYILKYQDTIYLEKFNVDKNSPYGVYEHQYMQNIQAPRSESASTKKIYTSAGSLNSAFVFKIPIFNNMPNENGGTEEPKIPLESIALDKENVTLFVGQSAGLYVTYQPQDTTDDRSISWKSGDERIATVANGRITAVGTGRTVITATVGKCTAQCSVLVEDCTVTFMKRDGKTALGSAVSVGYGGVVPKDVFEQMQKLLGNPSDSRFVGWYTGENGTGSRFDETTAVYGKAVAVYPCYVERNKGFYVLPVGDQTYTGSAIKPKVQVYDSTVRPDGALIGEQDEECLALREGVDYTVSYKNNKKVNLEGKPVPTIVVKGKGNYTGTQQISFAIVPKALTDTDITAEDITVAYGNKVIKSAPTVRRNGKKLAKNKDYTVTYPLTENGAYRTPGVYPVVIEGKGGYSGTITVYETITNKILLSKVSVAKIANQIYSNEEMAKTGGIRPDALKVTYKKEALVESTDGGKTGDYTVTYENDGQIGTAKAIITAAEKSAYAGSKSVTYKIVGTPINKAKVEGLENKEYSETEQSVRQSGYVLTLGDQTLVESKDGGRTGDYVVSYAGAAASGAVKAGTAAIIFKGINAYSGQLKKSYKILPYALDQAVLGRDITLSYHTQDEQETELSLTGLSGMTTPYVKGGSKPVMTVNFRGQALVQGKDYTVKYQNNNTVTTAETPENKLPTYTIKGKGSFKGTLKGSFTITDGRMDKPGKVTMTFKAVVYREKKNAYKPKVTIRDVSGAALAAGRDYDKNLQYTYAKDEKVLVLEEGTLVERERKAGESVGEEDIPQKDAEIRVTAKGLGAYAGTGSSAPEISAVCRIVAADLAKVKVKVAAKDYQDGRPVTLTAEDLTLTVSGAAQPLEYGKDYQIKEGSYVNHTKKGKAKVTLQGLGNYGGEKTITYSIGAKKLWW